MMATSTLEGVLGPSEPRVTVAALGFLAGYGVFRVVVQVVAAALPGWADASAWAGAGLGVATGGALIAVVRPRLAGAEVHALHEGEIAGAVISPGRERPSRRGGLEVLEEADVAWSWPAMLDLLGRTRAARGEAARGPIELVQVFQQPRVTLLEVRWPVRLPDGRWLDERTTLRRPTGRSSPRPEVMTLAGDPDQWTVGAVTSRPTTAAEVAARLAAAPGPGPVDPQVSSQVRAMRARCPEWDPGVLVRRAEQAWGEAVAWTAGTEGPEALSGLATPVFAEELAWRREVGAELGLPPLAGGEVVRSALARVARDGWNELVDVDLEVGDQRVRVRMLHPSGDAILLEGWRVWRVVVAQGAA